MQQGKGFAVVVLLFILLLYYRWYLFYKKAGNWSSNNAGSIYCIYFYVVIKPLPVMRQLLLNQKKYSL
jgi:hypothetical protein